MRGVNDHEAADLLDWCLERGYELRFIEQMPLDAQHGWDRADMVTAEEILERLGERFTLLPGADERRGAAPAERWLVDGRTAADGGPARVGVIASVTRPFCAPATVPGSPPTARSATASSPPRRPTCAPRCATAPTTPRSPRCGGRRCGARRPAAASTTPAFAQPDRPDVRDRRLSRDTPGMSTEIPHCSAKGCRQVAVWVLAWNNPKLHTPERRKTWLACDEHKESAVELPRPARLPQGRGPARGLGPAARLRAQRRGLAEGPRRAAHGDTGQPRGEPPGISPGAPVRVPERWKYCTRNRAATTGSRES